MSRSRRLALLALGVGVLFSMVAEARTCFISQIRGVAFGTYLPIQASPLDVRGRIRVRCEGRATPGQIDAYTVRISGVINAGLYGRQMRSGTQLLDYNLFKDAARTDIWGDGSFGMTPLVRIIRNSNGRVIVGNHPIYGRIPPYQNPGPGAYLDVVDVIIEF